MVVKQTVASFVGTERSMWFYIMSATVFLSVNRSTAILSSDTYRLLYRHLELKYKVLQGSRVLPIWSHVRPKFSRVRLTKIRGRTCATSRSRKKKVSATLKVSLWFNNRHTLDPYRGLNQSEIVKGEPTPSDWAWSIYSCTCVYVWKCVCCCSQTEREVSSRDARSVANLATLSLDLALFFKSD